MHTIAAVATPPGFSGLAVVRVSGPACIEALSQCLKRTRFQPRQLHTGVFRNPKSGEHIDHLTFHVLPGPASPTGEDVLELFPHGNPLILESILRGLLLVPGIRLAEPGEFTRRAFEHGKIDLIQAEAVGEMVHAQNRAALRNAQRLLQGEASEKLKVLRDALLELSTRLELDADFSEEEADPDYASWKPRIESVRVMVEKMAEGFSRSRSWRTIPRVVLFGAPNAGKSSLINALVAQDRLLVSEIAGTTRDFVEVPLRLPSGTIHLVDTAGLGKPVDDLDARAMDKTRSQLSTASLNLFVLDGSLPNHATIPENATLVVATHSDLPSFHLPKTAVAVSCVGGEGLQALLQELESRLFVESDEGEALLVTERQAMALEHARERLLAAEENLLQKPAVEILAFEVAEASKALRELLGEITPDDVLHKLFAGFCIGK